jgi:DNA polymerase-3 subunit delta'
MAMNVLPWQRSLWQQLAQRRRHDNVPHGLLLSGAAGVGKRHFAQCLTRALLCVTPTEEGFACQQCRSCELASAGSHPDALIIEPAELDKAITVDQIRGIGDFLALTCKHAVHKVVSIAPAERMNINAANSLLKNLEEPTRGAVLILVSDRAALLPATVRSRCQRLDFAMPPRDVALSWLADQLDEAAGAELLLSLAQGAPLAALAAQQSLPLRAACFDEWLDVAQRQRAPLEVAAGWLKQDVPSLLAWCVGWASDLIRLRAAGAAQPLHNPDLRAPLQNLANGLDLRQIFAVYDRLSDALRMSRTTVNAQLLLEDALLFWAAQFPRGITAASIRRDT